MLRPFCCFALKSLWNVVLTTWCLDFPTRVTKSGNFSAIAIWSVENVGSLMVLTERDGCFLPNYFGHGF